jgi:opacity protein-like surface antigen
MKRVVLVVVLCLVAAAPFARAVEPDSTASPERPNSLYKGAKAIQFQFSDFFEAGSIHFKQHRSAGHALRLGLTFGGNLSDLEASVDTTSAPVLKGTGEANSYSVDIELIMQRYANVFASAHVFYGIGPFFTTFSSHSERQVTELSTGESIFEEQDHDSWSTGGRIVLGAEWFISRALSLDLEYFISGGYRSATREASSHYQFEPDIHSIEESEEVFVNGGSARIGLGIYF